MEAVVKGRERTKTKSQVEMLFESVVWLDFVVEQGGTQKKRNASRHILRARTKGKEILID